VIMLSGSLEGDQGHDATEEGANAFLTKFLSASELLATVERVLNAVKPPPTSS
jgi:DNA-binding response OmpR family regulator